MSSRAVFAVLVVAVVSFTYPMAPAAGAFITNDQCKQSEEFLWQKSGVSISVDCSCPPNFEAIIRLGHTFCVLLTEPLDWAAGQKVCVASGTVDDYYELDVGERTAIYARLLQANVNEFWISVQREAAYSSPRKKLPGEDWGKPLDLVDDLHLEQLEKPSSVGNCLKISIQSNFSTASFEDCNTRYPHLCVYKRDTLLQLHCDADELTTRYSYYQNYCFKLESTFVSRPDWHLYKVDSHRKFQLYQTLHHASKQTCQHAVVQSNVTLLLQQALNTTGKINATHFVAIGADGIMTLVDQFDCVAYQHEPQEFPLPQLTLNFDRLHRQLLLTVINGLFLWREKSRDRNSPGVSCFTDADAELLKKVKIKRKVWPPEDHDGPEEPSHIYELKLYGDFPGLYWCEGHAVPNFTLVQSDRIVAQKKDADVHVFAVLMRMAVESAEVENFLQKSYLKTLMKRYMDELKEFRQEEVRQTVKLLKRMQVMRVESVDGGSNCVVLLLHVAVKNSDESNGDNDDDDDDISADLEENLRRHFYLKKRLRRMFEKTNSTGYQFIGINSTEFCLPEQFGDDMQWPAAPIGHTVTPRNLCLIESSGLPLSRKCIGDRTYGGVWQRDDLQMPFQCSRSISGNTRTLFKYQTATPSELAARIEAVFADLDHVMTEDLIPADIFYLSGTIDNIRRSAPLLLNNGTISGDNGTVIGNNGSTYYCGLVAILSRVMAVNESIVFRSQAALNTTNILLDSADDLINQLALANSTGQLANGADSLNCPKLTSSTLYVPQTQSATANGNGTMLFRTPRLVLLVANPLVDGISGIALLRASEHEDQANVTESDFESYRLRLISMNESEEDILVEDNLEIAGYVPSLLLDKIQLLHTQLQENITTNTTDPTPQTSILPLRVVISIYFNDHIFRETTNGTISRANSKIISVTVPGFGSDLPGEVPIFFREADANRSSDCGFWEFEPPGISGEVATSRWSFRGCQLADRVDDVTLCKCSHLTSFSRLCSDVQTIEGVTVSQVFVGDSANPTLDIISTVGCTLSMLGVLGIFATGALFPSWRSTANSKVLLQLSLAIAAEMLIIFLDGPDIDYTRRSTEIKCALRGGSLHYIILVTFMWMLVIAYLVFMRYVKVLGQLRPSHCILKASILSWGLPLVPVIVFVSLDYTLYLKRNNVTDICYPHGMALYLGLLAPIAMVLLANIGSFLLIIYNVFAVPSNLTRSTLDRSTTFSQLRVTVFLFFLLGLPWIFGMMITAGGGIVFSYLFCLTAPLQGFIMFVYFILMEPSTRKLWCAKINKLIGRTPEKISADTLSTKLENASL